MAYSRVSKSTTSIFLNALSNQAVSTPLGFPILQSIYFPIKSGGIGSKQQSSASGSASIQALGHLEVDAVGDSTGTASGALGRGLSVDGEGISLGTITVSAPASLSVTGRIGASPGPTDIAEAVWGGVILDGGYNARQLMQILASIAVGKTIIDGTTVTFRNLDDDKDRVVAEMTGSERASIAISED